MHEDIYSLMDACNGEMRAAGLRYGGCYMCLITLVEQEDGFWEHFEDMNGGDPDYLAARDILENEEMQIGNNFVFVTSSNFMGAIQEAHAIATERWAHFIVKN